MSEYKAKGSHVLQVISWVNKQLEEATAFEKLMVGIAPKFPKAHLVLPGGWYDAEPLYETIKIAAGKRGLSPEDATCEIARKNALDDLKGIYSAFLRLTSPTLLLSFTPRLWSTYVRFGTATALRNEPGNYLGEGKNIPEQLLGWACGAWRGFVPAAIELAGGKSPKATIIKRWREGENSGLHCEIQYS